MSSPSDSACTTSPSNETEVLTSPRDLAANVVSSGGDKKNKVSLGLWLFPAGAILAYFVSRVLDFATDSSPWVAFCEILWSDQNRGYLLVLCFGVAISLLTTLRSEEKLHSIYAWVVKNLCQYPLAILLIYLFPLIWNLLSALSEFDPRIIPIPYVLLAIYAYIVVFLCAIVLLPVW